MGTFPFTQVADVVYHRGPQQVVVMELKVVERKVVGSVR
jgi:hypothetical protein